MSGSTEKTGGVAAFFDLDGTLLAKPSLERRLFKLLRARKQIPWGNYLLWLWEAARLARLGGQAPRGWQKILQGNKMYLRGVRTGETESGGQLQEELSIGPLFSGGVERAAWHARQGHRVILVTGTLEPLALRAAMLLRSEFRRRGCEAAVHICAARLEVRDGLWSGRIAGEAMFGEAKARALRQMAREWQLDLAQCSAYGDSASDRWMLASVGKAYAVNPSRGLRRIARRVRWPVICWTEEAAATQKTQKRGEDHCATQEKLLAPLRESAK